MKLLQRAGAWLRCLRRSMRDDRGDVPGWVMVTVMTAILVVAILAVFEPQLESALSGVIDSVSGG